MTTVVALASDHPNIKQTWISCLACFNTMCMISYATSKDERDYYQLKKVSQNQWLLYGSSESVIIRAFAGLYWVPCYGNSGTII